MRKKKQRREMPKWLRDSLGECYLEKLEREEGGLEGDLADATPEEEVNI
jgi:hypothetical protein